MLAATSRHFDPTDQGLKSRGMLLRRFQAFNDSDQSLKKGHIFEAAGAFSAVVALYGKKIGIAGINTAWLCKDDFDEKKLTPGKSIVEQALKNLDEAEIRIVLGHHPISWFLPAEQKQIKSLFGQNSVIYLHGHLHEEWVEPTYGGGHQFLAIQSGAAFQAREREKWRNGLVWGEADLEAGEIRLQPRRWIPDQQAWVPATDAFHEIHRKSDWWHYPVPGSELAKKIVTSSVSTVPPPPKGWAVCKPSELASYLKPLEEDAAVRFFNGAAPSWAIALSTSIPRRKIVNALTDRFKNADASARPFVTVLLAAGCEGKTTALLQAAYQIVQSKAEWQILRRVDDAEPFQSEALIPSLSEGCNWLIVIDEADHAAKAVADFLNRMPALLKSRVHFLLACRDSDWLGSHADSLRWYDSCNFQQERLTGLDIEDARALISAWESFGKAGLGDLASISKTSRVPILIEQARDEAKTNQGALFGALLNVRHGSDLPNHARMMLERLGQRLIPGGLTLRHALAYVAAMHSEGLEFLSRPVLAQVLSCPLNKLHREILVPLGQEAAATSTSSFIFTRHRRIAQAVIDVLEKDFGVDIGELYVELGRAAIEVIKQGEYLPENPSQWRYRFSRSFFDEGKRDLALRIANAVLDSEPNNFKTILSVSNMYRDAGATDKAVDLFRCINGRDVKDRGYYVEWGTAEGVNGDAAVSAVLLAYSLSDDCGLVRINNDQALIGLSALGLTFRELFSKYRESVFRNARVAVGFIGQHLHITKITEVTAGHLQRHIAEGMTPEMNMPNLEEAFALLQEAIASAELIGVNEFAEAVVPDAAHLDFSGLKRLVYASAETQNR